MTPREAASSAQTNSLGPVFREIARGRADEFVAKGYKRRHFFPHRVYRLPKCGPDGFKLAGWMCGFDDPAVMAEIVLYAEAEVLKEFPEDLFFDEDLIWHQQQFGRSGQVATASLVVTGETVYSITHVSDLVQRIARRREHKTRVEKIFKGWNHMLLNAVLDFALDQGAQHVRIPTAALAARHTDRSRNVDPTMFERIYDLTVNSVLPTRSEGEWWVVDLEAVRGRVVRPERRVESRAASKSVCICHEIERGLGHTDAEPRFAQEAERVSPRALAAMCDIEASAGVRATYSVVGSLLDGLHAQLKAAGHCVAFHSFDHRLDRRDQLSRCREVDYRIKGYRLPCSRITPELTDQNLLFHNFEWLASSPRSLGARAPELRAGLVRIPVGLDDFSLHRGATAYGSWERSALDLISKTNFAAISLHDCYGPRWLDHYPDFLTRVASLAELRTLDEVAAEVTLASAT